MQIKPAPNLILRFRDILKELDHISITKTSACWWKKIGIGFARKSTWIASRNSRPFFVEFLPFFMFPLSYVIIIISISMILFSHILWLDTKSKWVFSSLQETAVAMSPLTVARSVYERQPPTKLTFDFLPFNNEIQCWIMLSHPDTQGHTKLTLPLKTYCVLICYFRTTR